MEIPFADRLRKAVTAAGCACVVGLDPRPERLPVELARHPEGVLAGIDAFHRFLLQEAAGRIPCVKPQVAFFEALGAGGYELFLRTCRQAAELGFLVIGDVKRGDIGSTARAYAQAHFAQCDALTVNPYLGSDGVEPFLSWCREKGKGIFVLVRTSNPGNEFQPLALAGGGTLAEAVARAVADWNEGMPGDRPGDYGPVGAVVGATRPEEIPLFRRLLRRSWLLLPGYGAQGATAADLREAFDGEGRGALVNSSRGITACFDPADPAWKDKVRGAIDSFHREIAAIQEA